MPPMLGLLQCEKAPIARSGSTWLNAPLMASKMRIWIAARPPLDAGKRGLKNDPGRATTLIGRMPPSLCGRSASENTLRVGWA